MNEPNKQERLSLASVYSQEWSNALAYWHFLKLRRKLSSVNTLPGFRIFAYGFYADKRCLVVSFYNLKNRKK